MVVIYSYTLDLEQLKGTISSETFKEPSQRTEAKKVKEDFHTSLVSSISSIELVSLVLGHQEASGRKISDRQEQVVLYQAQILSARI